MNTIERFIDIIDNIKPNENGCKIWPKGINGAGYGHYHLRNKIQLVHRLVFFYIYPHVETDFHVRHKCDVRSCCNIEHLEHGTHSENMQDAYKRKRRVVGEECNLSRFKEKDVLDIRSRYPKETYYRIAKDYGCHPTVISAIVKRKSWRHI